MSRCILIGGSGFIGSHLSEKLSENGEEVIVISRKEPLIKLKRKNLSYINADFNDLDSITKVLKKKDLIFDLVGNSQPFTSMSFPIDEVNRHIYPHASFIEAACKKGVGKIIFASSGGSVYGEKKKFPIKESETPHPLSPYAISKVTIEHYLSYFGRTYSTPTLTYRISNPYGERQIPRKGFGVIPTLFANIIIGSRPTIFGNGEIVRDFIYISDVIEAISTSFNKNTKFSVYNLGSGEGVSLNDLWKQVKRITGTKLAPITVEKRLIDIDKSVLDITRFQKEFDWSPKVVLAAGLERTWDWVKLLA